MKVEVIFDPDCPNVPEARAQLLRAFAEAGISPRWIEWNRDSTSAPLYARAFGFTNCSSERAGCGGAGIHARECLLSPVS
jgi:hypothetical protein